MKGMLNIVLLTILITPLANFLLTDRRRQTTQTTMMMTMMMTIFSTMEITTPSIIANGPALTEL